MRKFGKVITIHCLTWCIRALANSILRSRMFISSLNSDRSIMSGTSSMTLYNWDGYREEREWEMGGRGSMVRLNRSIVMPTLNSFLGIPRKSSIALTQRSSSIFSTRECEQPEVTFSLP